MRGDPHFTTADRVEYTFNGLGEYILTRSTDMTEANAVEIQVRWQISSFISLLTAKITCDMNDIFASHNKLWCPQKESIFIWMFIFVFPVGTHIKSYNNSEWYWWESSWQCHQILWHCNQTEWITGIAIRVGGSHGWQVDLGLKNTTFNMLSKLSRYSAIICIF